VEQDADGLIVSFARPGALVLTADPPPSP
jgi:hypothetical protein